MKDHKNCKKICDTIYGEISPRSTYEWEIKENVIFHVELI